MHVLNMGGFTFAAFRAVFCAAFRTVGRMHVKHTTTTWECLSAIQNECTVTLRSRTQSKTTGVRQLGKQGRGHIDTTFQFVADPNHGGVLLVMKSTMYSDSNADFVWWKDLLCYLWLVPCCCVTVIYAAVCLRCWCPTDKKTKMDAAQRTIQQANTAVGQKINIAMQGTVQANSNSSMIMIVLIHAQF